MSEIAIRAAGLGKQYRIGRLQTRSNYQSLRADIMQAITAPFRRASPARPAELIWALQDVSFEIKTGEVVGIIGRNGAGKSTLLKLLARITEPTTGEIFLHGRVGSLLEVGTGFHPELTGRENLYLNGAILGMARREIQSKFDAIVDFAEIERFIDTPVKHYSSGMYMRLAFAVAAHLEPEILVVDEVLAVGDAQFQKKCLGKMGEVAKQGRTVLFVSHNMNAIEQLCERAILLHRGRVARMESDVRAVITEYLFGRDAEGLEPSEWVNPGRAFDNPWFRPTRFFVCAPDGQPLPMPASNQDKMYLQLEGEVEVADPALTIGYAIYSETGTLLYWSYQTDQPEDRWPLVSPGPCVLRGRIPSRLFNEGVYKIELIASLHYRQWLLEPGVNAPSLYLRIQGGLSDSPYWMVKRPGELAPVIQWQRVEPPQ